MTDNDKLTGIRIVYMSTVPYTIWSLTRGQLAHFRRLGMEITAVSSPGELLEETAKREGVKTWSVPMERSKPSPIRDLSSFIKLWRFFRKARPHIVNSGTPKATLLAMTAGFLAGVPVRIYTMRSSHLINHTGFMAFALKIADAITCAFSTKVICVSPSLMEFVAGQGYCGKDKLTWLANGSSNGIDTERFDPDRVDKQAGIDFRRKYGIPQNSTIIGFVGRITPEKGVDELLHAWDSIKSGREDLMLLMVGDHDLGAPVSETTRQKIESDPRIVLTGTLDDVVPAYAAMDLVVLPTHREGFGNVLMEANAMRLPAVGTRIPGCRDAIEDGVTGMLVPRRDPASLAEAILELVKNPERRLKMGQAGRERVLAKFTNEIVWNALEDIYRNLVSQKIRR